MHTFMVLALAAPAPAATAMAVSRASTRCRFEVPIEVLPRRCCDGAHSREGIDADETAPGISFTHSEKFQADCRVAHLLRAATLAVGWRAHTAPPVCAAPALDSARGRCRLRRHAETSRRRHRAPRRLRDLPIVE